MNSDDRMWVNPETHLCDIKVRLHHEVRIQRILPGGIGVIEEIFNFGSSGLLESRLLVYMRR
jgi:hypothetical protein